MEGGDEPFTQTPLIHDNLRVNDRSRSLKFFLQILAPHIEEQIPHIHGFSRLSTRSAPTSFRCLRSKSSSSTKTLRGACGDFTCGLHSGSHRVGGGRTCVGSSGTLFGFFSGCGFVGGGGYRIVAILSFGCSVCFRLGLCSGFIGVLSSLEGKGGYPWAWSQGCWVCEVCN